MDRRELVTAALLGTDRRPAGAGAMAEGDPAVLLLDQAVRSGLALRAGAVLTRLPPPADGPVDELARAAPAAQHILAGLLVRPQAELLDLWLRAAVDAGVGVAPQHWAALAAYASRSPDVSRPLLSAALGEAGRWFVGQNPQWSALAGALAGRGAEVLAPSPTARIEPDQLQADPELILAVADPWPRPLVEVALMIIGTGRLQWRTPAYATSLAARLSFDHLPLVRSAMQFFAPPDGPPAARLVRDAFTALDRVLQLRVEIQQAFGPTQSGDPAPDVPHDQESS